MRAQGAAEAELDLDVVDGQRFLDRRLGGSAWRVGLRPFRRLSQLRAGSVSGSRARRRNRRRHELFDPAASRRCLIRVVGGRHRAIVGRAHVDGNQQSQPLVVGHDRAPLAPRVERQARAARAMNAALVLGALPIAEFGRNAIQTAKQVLIQGEFDRRETERRHSAIVSALSPDERRALLERLQTIEAPTVASPGGVKQPG